jgi:lycopene beta-cyclase
MPADADVIILGGGCAGLSLGLRLSERSGQCGRVVIVEQRAAYRHDRSWSFWRLTPQRFDGLIEHAWLRMAIRSGARSVLADCRATSYQSLPSGAFYAEAVRIIGAGTTVELKLGTTVTQPPRRIRHGWEIDTSGGRLSTRWLIDTRPSETLHPDASTLWQSFSGREIHSAADRFDPTTVELMDFTPASTDEVCFTYVLPITSKRALVETTVFGTRPLTSNDLDTRLTRALARYTGGGSHEVLRTEHGALPMGLKRVSTTAATPLRAGVAGGAARAATGYAFQRIQRWADACADALREGQPPLAAAPDPPHTRAMDKLFLNALRRRPELGPEIFLALFGRVDPARVIRFLSDCGSPGDHAAIVAALPARALLSALLGRRATTGRTAGATG